MADAKAIANGIALVNQYAPEFWRTATFIVSGPFDLGAFAGSMVNLPPPLPMNVQLQLAMALDRDLPPGLQERIEETVALMQELNQHKGDEPDLNIRKDR